MLIVDSHIHLWNGGQAPPTHGGGTFRIEDAIREMDAAGISAAIDHPPHWDPLSDGYAIEAARRFPDRFATLGALKLDAPDAPDRVRQWRSRPGMIGLRFICFAEGERDWPTNGTMDWLWPLAEALGLPVAIAGPNLLSLIDDLAPRYPGLKLTVDHMGYIGPAASPGVLFNQMEGLHGWARYPNVAVKLTGLPDYAPDAFPYRSFHPVVRRLYDAFGPDRLFWGSDITRLKCSWKQSVDAFTEEMPWLSDDDKRRIMGEAFCTWHGWWPGLPKADSAAQFAGDPV